MTTQVEGNKPIEEQEFSAAALTESLKAISQSCEQLWRICAADEKLARIAEIDVQLAKGWDQVDDALGLQKERTRLISATEPLQKVKAQVAELDELLALAAEEGEAALLADIKEQVDQLQQRLERIELDQHMNHPYAQENAYLDIHFGSGGVESQDWAQMLKRMYVGYANLCDWKSSTIEETLGEAGIKSVTLLVEGLNAYGMLRTETGVHRLVRKSPFDSNHRRHTTFASVFVYPVLPENEEVAINQADLRIDTYRASGAGGQHVNKTDSAVRITHLPTNIVVQCQNDRSQHKNRITAMSMLRSRLDMARQEEEAAKQKEIEKNKADISWGSQIRSYVLDQSRIKDLRTGVEVGNTQAVLDGDLRRFIDASLRQGI